MELFLVIARIMIIVGKQHTDQIGRDLTHHVMLSAKGLKPERIEVGVGKDVKPSQLCL